MPRNENSESFKDYYGRLNNDQRTAVDTIDGALLVLAGPGTGKTQLLSVRAANILKQKKIAPENILILTFTNAAARAMRERLASIVGHDGYNVEVETFHSFANSIVLESEEAIRYVKDKVEISEVEKVKSIEYILDNTKGVEPLRPFGSPYIHRREIEKRISELKNEGISPDEFKKSLRDLAPDGVNLEEKNLTRLKALAVIYEEYEKLKDSDCTRLFDERGRIDYDDMIIIALNALKNDKVLCENFRKQYQYIMVDEYQDTNGAQLELLFAILDPEVPNVCCVGDDDQAIYRFQGATLSNFRILKEKLPELKTVTLKDNYRSTGEIVDLSDKIIVQLPENERIAVKKLKSCKEYDSRDIRFLEFLTPEEELAFMVSEIKKQIDVIKQDRSIPDEEKEKPLNNIAVLVRKRAQILDVIDAFLKAGIPYATDGEEDIRREKRVRQMLDVIELAGLSIESFERKSLAIYKILTADYMNIFHSDVLKLIGMVTRDRSLDLFQQFQEHFVNFKKDSDGCFLEPSKEDSAKLKIAEQLKLKDPYALHKAAWVISRLIKDAADRPVHDILMQYIEDTGLYNFILRRYKADKVLRVRDLRSLVSFVNIIKRSDLANPALGLEEFVAEMELRSIHGMPVKGELATLSQDGVRIYTAHKAKGLEFYTVFIPFCLQQKSWPLRRKADVVPLPPDIYKSKERVEEKNKIKLLSHYDELRLFYVASTRAKSHLVYTATPREKVIASPFMNHIGVEPQSGSPAEEEDFLKKFLKVTHRKDSFEGTSGILKDIIANLTLNPTSLNNYISCRRKFLYGNVLRLPGKKNQNLVFGNCAHKALEEVYSVYMKDNRFPPFSVFKRAFKQELEYQGVNAAINNACMGKLEKVKAWYDEESVAPVMPLELENKLEITLPGGFVFRGTFDKIEEDTAGGIKVIDYKTGKPDDHVKAIANCQNLSSHECDGYYRQLIAYKMLYEKYYLKRTGKVVTKGVLQFLEPVGATVKKYDMEKGAYRKEIIDLTDDMVRQLEAVIQACWHDIQILKFDKLEKRDDKKRCRRCEFDPICWSD